VTPYQAFWLRRRCTPAEFRAMRERLGYTQEKLGKLFGLDWQSIHRREDGESKIDFASEALLRAMVIEHGEIPYNFAKWLKRLAGAPSQAT
jgi:DNA-binding XRE family transcriptional regulator